MSRCGARGCGCSIRSPRRFTPRCSAVRFKSGCGPPRGDVGHSSACTVKLGLLVLRARGAAPASHGRTDGRAALAGREDLARPAITTQGPAGLSALGTGWQISSHRSVYGERWQKVPDFIDDYGLACRDYTCGHSCLE
jgi:hypothetical protein